MRKFTLGPQKMWKIDTMFFLELRREKGNFIDFFPFRKFHVNKNFRYCKTFILRACDSIVTPN